VLGREDLRDRPEFRNAEARNRHRVQLTELLDSEFRRRSTSEWLSRLQGVLPVAPVRGLAEALDSDFLRETGMLAQVEHPSKPDLRLLAAPLRFDGRRPALRACSPLGRDTDSILGENT
jgi:crotonobetainyl-CoA:carnitine CoA-transferase CaiB-like acyl-CoA transferase